MIGSAPVRVAVPARLHLGFLDLEGAHGRRFASLGITLEGPFTRLSLGHGQGISARGPDAARARRHLEQLTKHFALQPGFQLTIEEAIPAHVGLGSGTQLALATGTALAELVGLNESPRSLAGILARGRRSGIGLGAFEGGGVLLDGGVRCGEDEGAVPPILTRLPFPTDWRILLIYDRASHGIHGRKEITAFGRLPGFPGAQAAELCRLTVMALLPALAEEDFGGFAASVSELQRVVGDHFAPVQGGRFASPRISAVLEWLTAQGFSGLGQSSWGPTGFALIDSADEGERLLNLATRYWAAEPVLGFELRAGRNRGAEITLDEPLRALNAS